MIDLTKFCEDANARSICLRDRCRFVSNVLLHADFPKVVVKLSNRSSFFCCSHYNQLHAFSHFLR